MDNNSNKSLDGFVPAPDQNNEPKKINITEEPVANEPIVNEPAPIIEPLTYDQATNLDAPELETTNDTTEVDNNLVQPYQQNVSTPPQPATPLPVLKQEPTTKPVPNEVVSLRERNKSLKIWLVVFIVIFVGVASALVVYFFQASKAQSDLEKQQAQNQQLKSQVAEQQQSATQSQINELNTQITTLKAQNAELTNQLKVQSEYITTLTKTATQLKTTCGTACSSITIPTPPASTVSTTN